MMGQISREGRSNRGAEVETGEAEVEGAEGQEEARITVRPESEQGHLATYSPT